MKRSFAPQNSSDKTKIASSLTGLDMGTGTQGNAATLEHLTSPEEEGPGLLAAAQDEVSLMALSTLGLEGQSRSTL